MNKFLVIAALLGAIEAVKISDNSDPNGKNVDGVETYKE